MQPGFVPPAAPSRSVALGANHWFNVAPLRLLQKDLLDRGSYHPQSSTALGTASAPEEILRPAETEISHHWRGFWVCRRIRASTGEPKVLRLYSIAKTVIERRIKVRGETNPYDPQYTEYFE